MHVLFKGGNVLKKYISVLIVTALMTAAFMGFGGAASAGPGDAGISLSPDTVSVDIGDTVNTTATITNNTGEAFIDYRVKVGGTSLSFGDGATLAPGDAGEISVDIPVSESTLGTIQTLTAEYKTASDGGWQQGDSASLKINGKDQTPLIACTVKASQTLAAVGDQITFTFTIENQGYVILDNIKIWSDTLKKGSPLNSTVWSIPSKKSFTWPYKYTFTKPMTVSFYITYTVSGSSEEKNYPVNQQFELTEEERHVVVSLTADKTNPQPGEEVTFTLTIKNDGNVDYTNLTVTYEGEDIGAPARSLVQGAELKKQYKRAFDISSDVKFTVSVRDHTGETRSVDTNTIKILLPIDPEALKSGLKIVIESDRDEFTSAGSVNFSGYIANDSDYTLSDVTVTADPSIGEIYSVSEMAAGARQSISCSADVNETTSFKFILTAKDRNGDVYTVETEPMTVTIQSFEQATADPFESAPSLPSGNDSSDPLLIWFIVAGVLAVLVIGVGVALFVLWRGGRSPSRASGSRSSKGKKPMRGGYKKPVSSRSYRDRNNF